MKIKIFADGADMAGILKEYKKGKVQGFTTNPSLMKKAGVTDYKHFAMEILSNVKDMPISFEVFSDELEAMKKEALEIASWADNVYVKIPVTNTKGEFTGPLLAELAEKHVKLNVTAVFTMEQVKQVAAALSDTVPAIISIFAGRISDTGTDATKIVRESVQYTADRKNIEILWASCRDLYSIVEAEACGCQIITVPNAILEKLKLFGKDLTEYSLETVREFFRDADSLGYKIV